MCNRYEEQVREKRNAIQKEDLSDMVAEHAAKQKVSYTTQSLVLTLAPSPSQL